MCQNDLLKNSIPRTQPLTINPLRNSNGKQQNFQNEKNKKQLQTG